MDKYAETYGITPAFKTARERAAWRESMSSSKLYKLMKRPEKEKRDDMARFTAAPGYHHQMDLLFLPSDRGYKYALVVCDIGTRLVDAEPLKSKAQTSIHAALRKIYQRSILKQPQVLTTDAGSEFTGLARAFPTIHIRQAPVNRHRYVAVVENFNKRIGNAIFIAQYNRELKSGKDNTQWIKDLPIIIKLLNEKSQKKQKQQKQPAEPAEAPTLPSQILNPGDKVYKLADYVQDLRGKRIKGTRRAADLAYENKIYEIKDVIITPDKPIYYTLSGVDHVQYTRQQLKPA